MSNRRSTAEGFSLVEVLVAAATLIVALSSLAQLVTIAAFAARRAQAITLAAVYAEDKLESLMPAAALDAVIVASPANTLAENVDGYCDFIDIRGGVVGGGTSAPADAVYVRRWAITPIPSAEGVAALQVVVVDTRRTGADARTVGVVHKVP